MLAWLQKGTKRTRVPEPDTSTEVQVQPETSGTNHEIQTCLKNTYTWPRELGVLQHPLTAREFKMI